MKYAAYRKLALNTTDRVSTLGEDIKKAAEKKFGEINEAKEKSIRHADCKGVIN